MSLKSNILCTIMAFFGRDASHPSNIGEIYMGNAIYQAYQQGQAFIRNVNDLSKLHCQLLLDYGNSHFETKNAYITVNSKAELIINFDNTTTGTLSNIRVHNYPYRYDFIFLIEYY